MVQVDIAGPVYVGDCQNLWSALYSIQLLLVSMTHHVIGQFNFSSAFIYLFFFYYSFSFCFSLITPSIGKLRMTQVSFAKTRQSYEV